MNNTDKNFDSLIERFKKKVYNSDKGKLRLELLEKDLNDFIPQLFGKEKLNILDAGGGLGQISKRLLEYNHQITFCDISEKMIESARENFSDSKNYNNIEFINLPFQELPKKLYNSFDVVIMHAVLEWVAEPEESFYKLLNYLKPGGFISLMIYNKNSLIYYNAIRGNLNKIIKKDFTGYPNSLTPTNPLLPDEVENWLNKKNIKLICKSGIRSFYDYIHYEVQKKRSYASIAEIENTYNRVEPFASLGRYIHYIGMKNN